MDGDSYRAQQAAWPAGRTGSDEERREDRAAAPATDRFNAHAILQALTRHEAAQAATADEAYDEAEDADAEEDAIADEDHRAAAFGDPRLDDDETGAPVVSSLFGERATDFQGIERDSAAAAEDAPAEALAVADHVDGFADLALGEDFLADAEDDAPTGAGETDDVEADMWAEDREMDLEDGLQDDVAETSSSVFFGPADNAAHTEVVTAEDGLLPGKLEDEGDEDGPLLGEIDDDEDDREYGLLPGELADDAGDETTARAKADEGFPDIPLFDADAEENEDVGAGEPLDAAEDAMTVEASAPDSEATADDAGDELASIIGALGLGAATPEDRPETETLDIPAPGENTGTDTHDRPSATEMPGAGDDAEILESEAPGPSYVAFAADEDGPATVEIADEDVGADMSASGLPEDGTSVAPGAMAFAAVASDQDFASIDDPDLPGRKPRIALMGEFSAGKSTLSNLLIGASPLPTRVTATQLPPVWISWGEGQAYREDLDGTTHAIDVERIGEIDPSRTRVIRLFCQSDILELCDIIDMPGISDPNMASEVWERVIGKADGVIWCTHATQAWRQSEAAVWESLNPDLFSKSLLLITRFDKLRTEIDRARVVKRVERETRDLFAARLPISLTGALGAGDDAEKWERSGAADFTDRLVTLLHELSSTLGSKSNDRMERPLDASGERGATARPRSVQVHRPRSKIPTAPARVMPRRVRPAADGGRRDAHP